jgi:predicted alpha/beta-fold hydrolase
VTYRPAWWLPGPHAQTIWGAIARRPCALPTRAERWETPDGDFLELRRIDAPAERPRLLVLHGLEGSARSPYVAGFFAHARRRGWAADLLLFRSCGEPNRLARMYHSGETQDLDFVVRRIVALEPARPLVIAGVSLGGNVLLKWLGETGDARPESLRAAAAVSVPYDLERCARHLQRGFARVYERHFVRTLQRKARAKLARFPGLVPAARVRAARTLLAFDDAFTGPVHGFRDACDYYTQSSSIAFLPRVRAPTLLLNAVDDPFLPREVLERVRAIAGDNPALVPEFVPGGGHVGFVAGPVPWRAEYYADRRVVEFLARYAETPPR